jgi:hypothetical protein
LAYIDNLLESPQLTLRQQKPDKNDPLRHQDDSVVKGFPCSITSPQLQALKADMSSVFQGGFSLDEDVLELESPEHKASAQTHASKIAGIRRCFNDTESPATKPLSGGVSTGRRGEVTSRPIQVSPAVEAERKRAAEANQDDLQAMINAKLQLSFSTAVSTPAEPGQAFILLPLPHLLVLADIVLLNVYCL